MIESRFSLWHWRIRSTRHWKQGQTSTLFVIKVEERFSNRWKVTNSSCFINGRLVFDFRRWSKSSVKVILEWRDLGFHSDDERTISFLDGEKLTTRSDLILVLSFPSTSILSSIYSQLVSLMSVFRLESNGRNTAITRTISSRLGELSCGWNLSCSDRVRSDELISFEKDSKDGEWQRQEEKKLIASMVVRLIIIEIHHQINSVMNNWLLRTDLSDEVKLKRVPSNQTWFTDDGDDDCWISLVSMKELKIVDLSKLFTFSLIVWSTSEKIEKGSWERVDFFWQRRVELLSFFEDS